MSDLYAGVFVIVVMIITFIFAIAASVAILLGVQTINFKRNEKFKWQNY